MQDSNASLETDDEGNPAVGQNWRERWLRTLSIEDRLIADLSWRPENLLTACTEYFTWVAENPLFEERVNVFKGDITRYRIPRVRAMSIRSLALYIGVSSRMWRDWSHSAREDLRPVVEWANDVIWTQKFEAAAADLINATLAMRDLGLVDKQEVTSPDGSAKLIVQYQLPENGRDTPADAD